MADRVTMAGLAKELGVSGSTVSRALRGDRRIGEETRRRIVDAAEKLGYRPNPMVSTLMSMRSRSGGDGIDTVALVTDYRGGGGWRSKDVCQWEYEGLCRRANELGFRIEEFPLADYGHDGERLVRTLAARGIRGVLLGFSRERESRVKIDLSGFSVAGLSTYFREITVDRAHFHGLYNVRLAMERMREAGYRRTGLMTPEFNNRVSGYQWSSAMLDCQRMLPEAERCAPFLPENEDAEENFRRWWREERPDSLIVYKLPVKIWLSRLGLRLPEDVGIAWLFRTRAEMSDGPGIDGNLQRVGAAAFDLVVEGLNTNRTGIAEEPKEVLIRGKWLAPRHSWSE